VRRREFITRQLSLAPVHGRQARLVNTVTHGLVTIITSFDAGLHELFANPRFVFARHASAVARFGHAMIFITRHVAQHAAKGLLLLGLTVFATALGLAAHLA